MLMQWVVVGLVALFVIIIVSFASALRDDMSKQRRLEALNSISDPVLREKALTVFIAQNRKWFERRMKSLHISPNSQMVGLSQFEQNRDEDEDMRNGPELLYSEENEVFLENQINAVTRVIALVGKRDKLTFDGVFRRLADAERKANYLCGFVLLDEKDKEYKKALKRYLVENKFVVVDGNGFVMLTKEGDERAQTSLPSCIEEVL